MLRSLVLDALEQAPHDRRPSGGALLHHSDHGVQYLSINIERLAEAGIAPSVGSVGDGCDNALAETTNGLLKTELVRRRGSWRGVKAVGFAAFAWVDWFNHRRLLEPIGNMPPAEAEARHHAELEATALAAQPPNQIASGNPGAVQSRWRASRGGGGHVGPVNAAAFSPDGTRVVTPSWDETTRVWLLIGTLEQLVIYAHSLKLPRQLTEARKKQYLIVDDW